MDSGLASARALTNHGGMSRRLRVLTAALAVATLLWLVFSAAERALALAQRFITLPAWLQWTLGGALALFAVIGIYLLWIFLRPRKRRRDIQAPRREDLETRIERLQAQGARTRALSDELQELDRRRVEARLYVTVFGEISAGKSSLIAALAPGAELRSDVLGGTTRQVVHVDVDLGDGRTLRLADVPGSRESGGEEREAMARDEALRAHAVIYVASGDLTRTQTDELRWLAEFGKPMLLALNKADQWQPDERDTLLAKLRERTSGLVDAVVVVSAGGSERFRRELADGRVEQVERARRADIATLLPALARLTVPGAEALETARERAVLAGLHERTGELEASQRAIEAERIVARYSRRAIVGAMAAVAPGSDLIIQGALATAMARALGKIYDIGLTELQIEDFLKRARLTLRTSTSIVLAIAGNALKAFPGLGTLGGGVLHAFAYALIFDSVGNALSATLAERHTLDTRIAGDKLKTLLAKGGAARIKRLAALTVDALRERPDDTHAS